MKEALGRGAAASEVVRVPAAGADHLASRLAKKGGDQRKMGDECRAPTCTAINLECDGLARRMGTPLTQRGLMHGIQTVTDDRSDQCTRAFRQKRGGQNRKPDENQQTNLVEEVSAGRVAILGVAHVHHTILLVPIS